MCGKSLRALLLGDVVGDGVHHLLNIAHVDRVRPIGELAASCATEPKALTGLVSN